MEIITLIAEFVPETITLMFWLLFLSSSGLIFYWIKNRNKYLNYSHEIPESLIRDYQDSMDGNMQAKDSNFAQDSSLASVVKASDLSNSSSNILDMNSQMESLAAEISSLKENLQSRENVIEQLESKVPAVEDISDDELLALKKANEDLKNKLKEFELIEDDLVTLRDLQVENKELKNKLTDGESIDESEEVLGTEEDDDELTIVRGEEELEEDDEITIVSQEAKEPEEVARVSVQESEGDKTEVRLSDNQKTFGSVKVKDGNLFGRWDDTKGAKATSSSIAAEVEAAADVGVDSSSDDENVRIENLEQEIDQGAQVVSSNENEEDKSNEAQIVSENSVENSDDKAVVGDDISSEEGKVEGSKEENVVELKNSDTEGDDKKEEASTGDNQNDKSAEELLDEFEKMLG